MLVFLPNKKYVGHCGANIAYTFLWKGLSTSKFSGGNNTGRVEIEGSNPTPEKQ